jgi:hypothetical protein
VNFVGTLKSCARVARNGQPCKKSTLPHSDFCAIHATVQKRGLGFYLGVLGSLASLVGLVIYFYPRTADPGGKHEHVPFYVSTSPSTSEPIWSSYQGYYVLNEDKLEITLTEVRFIWSENPAPFRSIGGINTGLAIRSSSAWTMVERANSSIEVKLCLCDGIPAPDGKYEIDAHDLHTIISLPPNTDLSVYHLTFGPSVQTSDRIFESRAEWTAHSDEGIFKGRISGVSATTKSSVSQ